MKNLGQAIVVVLVVFGVTAGMAAAQTVVAGVGNMVVVAVIDDVVLADKMDDKEALLPGYDLVGGRRQAALHEEAGPGLGPSQGECVGKRCGSRFYHGTEVAKIILTYSQSDGVKYPIRILPVRVVDSELSPFIQRKSIINALKWAAGIHVDGMPDNPHIARVVNLSVANTGSHQCSVDLQEVINSVVARGIILVAAAGNTFGKSHHEPANCDGVISVGSLDSGSQAPAVWSAVDEKIDFYVPGVNMGETKRTGTSFAAPLVTAWIARWLTANNEFSLEAFKKAMAALDTGVLVQQ